MGTLTLTELQAEVRANLGNRTDLNDRLTRLLNQAQVRVAQEHSKWIELETSEDKVLTYTGVPATDKFLAFSSLTVSPHKIYSIRVLDGTMTTKLRYVPHGKVDLITPYPEDDGVERPTHYSIWQKKFEWIPIIDQAYTMRIRMSKFPAVFSDASPSAVSDLENKDDLLIAWATHRAFKSLGHKEESDSWFQSYTDSLDIALVDEITKPDAILTPQPSGDYAVTGEYWADPFLKSAP